MTFAPYIDVASPLPRLLVIGDSIAVQYSPYLRGALTGRMQWIDYGDHRAALADLDVAAGANNGDSATVLRTLRVTAQRRERPAEVVLLNCGLHDIKTDPATGDRQVPIDQYVLNLREIISTVAGMQCRLVWVRTTPCDERIHNARRSAFRRFEADCDAYNAAADDVMADADVPVIDLHRFTRLLGTSEDLYCDHVHFHDPIRAQQGAYIAGWLTAWLSCLPRKATPQ